MTTKLNCWEFKNCGREKGGLMVEILGECPVSQAMKYDGENGGSGAGRACWMVAGHSCGTPACNSRQGCACHRCEFYHRVNHEEAELTRYRFATSPINVKRAVIESPDLTTVDP